MGIRALGARLAAVAIGLCAATAVATAAPQSLTVVHTAQNSSLGTILVSASGRTLYRYASDAKNVSKCIASCASQWPPLVVAAGAKPVAGPGITGSWLSTLKRSDGKTQVTYRGMPLYLYAGDKKAGDVKGQGFGGRWHAIGPSGALITKSVKVSTGSTGSTGSGSSSTSGGSTSGGSTSGGTTSGGGSTGGGTSGGGTTGGGSTGGTNCDTNPGGYGCM